MPQDPAKTDQGKHAEDEWRRTVSLLQSTIESTTDGILVVNQEGRIVLFNERFKTIWKIPQHIIDQRDDDAALAHVTHQLKDPSAFLEKVVQLYADPGAESFDVLEFKDGRVFERYSCPHKLDGRPIGRVWSFRDVSRRRELESRLRQAQKMEAFGQLAAGIAHDFNNFLTVLQGNVSLLRAVDMSDADRAEVIKEIADVTEHASKLTRQLLTFSRRSPLESRALDLNDVVDCLTSILKHVLGEKIDLSIATAAGGAPVTADSGMMEQVLLNLAVNARDAMPKGGRLEIATEIFALGETEAGRSGGHSPGTYVRLSVTDSGVGISPEHLDHIFEPFFTTKEAGKGTGLGLATVFSIVEQHHGWIDVASEVNVGTTVRVNLPCRNQPGAAVCPSPSEAPALGGSETILLAEDEEAVRQLFRRALESRGYTVLTAESGPAALELWRRHGSKVSLLIADIVMPGGMSGRDLAERLQSDRPDLKVIYCSGYADEALGGDSPLCSGRNFLSKPFDLESLLRSVRNCLEGR
jgi:two-component system cell cycle sensor histidine kinase/response regulator CckA